VPPIHLAVCAIFRDEAPYLAEWVAFHRLVGVEHFFLYDNGSVDDPGTALAPHVADGCVTVRPWPIPFHHAAQRQAYADCLERARGQVRWLAFVDIDEFLFSPRSETLVPVLRQYERHPGVVVHWQIYGSSHHERASDAPVIARFTNRARTDWVRNRRVKTVLDPARTCGPIGAGCHHFAYRDGALAVNELEEPIARKSKPRYKKLLRPFYRQLAPVWDLFNLDPYSGTDSTTRSISVEHLRINHYPVKSREEFLRKARLKREKKRYTGIDYFAYHDRNDVFDPILSRYLPALETILHRSRGAQAPEAIDGGLTSVVTSRPEA
jgi:hypothetical protein